MIVDVLTDLRCDLAHEARELAVHRVALATISAAAERADLAALTGGASAQVLLDRLVAEIRAALPQPAVTR